jgi:2-methylcitrate dehydratase
MAMLGDLARFASLARWEDVSEEARTALKFRLVDAIGCAIAAQEGPPVQAIRAEIEEFGGNPMCSLIGGGRSSPADAALYNGALIRYLDFNDSYLAPGETCHPSDNIGAVLAAAQYAGAGGRELLTAIAVAYQVQCRLSDEAAVRWKHFDHVTHCAYAAAAGVSRAVRLDVAQTAHAIAMAGTALNAFRTTRTTLSHWKGLAAPFAAAAAMRTVFLAKRGVTGPLGVLDGRKGLMETITGPFEIDWSSEPLDAVTATSIKRYNAEVHSQSAIEAVLELRQAHSIEADAVEAIEVDTFDVAFSIIGGGDEGQKTHVRTKEEADHSLPYMLAVAMLDGNVLPEQYEPGRILRDDVQNLIQRVSVRADAGLSSRFPAALPTTVRIRLKDGAVWTRDKADFEGYRTRPGSGNTVTRKFNGLTREYVDDELRQRILDTIASLEEHSAEDLAAPLELAALRRATATDR